MYNEIMALADIQKKKAEERKREKRLVHFTNAVSRDFLQSEIFKSKGKAYKDYVNYLTKSFLDYLFFNEQKEIRELNDSHVQQFMVGYAPRRLTLTADTAKTTLEVLSKLFLFLETEGHIHNGRELSAVVENNKRSFLKLIPKARSRKTVKTVRTKPISPSKATKKTKSDVKVGRNDPCPCGSGKKYKKCCGKSS